jgi:N-acetylmuramoyl-L-alanine amidase
MRDITVARRAVLALAAAAAFGVWPSGSLLARSKHRHVRHHHHKSVPHPRRKPRHIVAIDAGHGGVDPGAVSPHGVFEKNVTLATARELARQLNATGRYRGVLTRRGDRFVPLHKRVERARKSHAELFLSIHADALPDHDLRGLSVYTLSDEASDRQTAALAKRENNDFHIGSVHLPREPREIRAILLDLARQRTNNQSLLLARAIVDELGQDVALLERPHRAAGFAVLKAPDIPSALVEVGCLSNPKEERLLQQHKHQKLLAHGLVRAIEDYFTAARPS